MPISRPKNIRDLLQHASIIEVHSALNRIHFTVDQSVEVPEIQWLLNRSVLFAGKRFRPFFSLLIARGLGVSMGQAAPFARAVELVHAASLAHDDVIDESEVRRDIPTLHKISSNRRAILAGDLLLGTVMKEISFLGIPKITHALSEAIFDLVEGEWLQNEARGKLQVSWEHLERVSRKKTGALLRWSAVAPGYLAQQSDDVMKTLADLGERVGLIFQWSDDLIDFEETTGKISGIDLKEKLLNALTLTMLDLQSDWRKEVEAYFSQSKTSFARAPMPSKELLTASKNHLQSRIETLGLMAIEQVRDLPNFDPVIADFLVKQIQDLSVRTR